MNLANQLASGLSGRAKLRFDQAGILVCCGEMAERLPPLPGLWRTGNSESSEGGKSTAQPIF